MVIRKGLPYCLIFITLVKCLLSNNLKTEHKLYQESYHRKRKHIRVKVFHYILPHWGISLPGDYTCDKHIKCEWIIGEQLTHLNNHLQNADPSHHSIPVITVALCNIHTLWEKYRDLKPQLCQLSTNISMYETEESVARFAWHFNSAAPHFDGYSSTHPNADVQRINAESLLNSSDFLPRKNFSDLIKAASILIIFLRELLTCKSFAIVSIILVERERC